MAAEVRDAATVMLVRDGAEGLEVFMVRRNLRSDFVGGAYVFPGGAVDPADGDADVQRLCAGRTDAEASAALGIPSGGLAYWVAAIRECFEEAGVLLACDKRGEVVRLDDPGVEARFARHRLDVTAGRRRLVEVCAEEGLRLAADALHYFSHWITPLGAPRRYDTRFFVAAAPDAQVPLHDHGETVASTWIAPGEALRRHRDGDFDLILPTIRNLSAIARFPTAADLLAAAAAIGDVPTIQPRVVVEEGGGVRILLPGDQGYADAGDALPEGTPLPGRSA